MSEIIEFLEPSWGIGIWLGRVILCFAASYLILWLVALILCRLKWLAIRDVFSEVYIGWMIPLALHSIFFTAFLLLSVVQYKQLGISPWFCVCYFLPIFVSGYLGIRLSLNIRERLKKRKLKEGAK